MLKLGKFKSGSMPRALIALAVILGTFSLSPSVNASPFGQGKFNANVPFGSQTSISIGLSGDVNLTLAPSGATFTGSGSSTVTVTSTDVEGYYLYMYAPVSTDLINGSNTIPTSANGSPAPLATNSWGFNTDGSGNYLGVSSTPSVIKTANGPYESGDNTTVNYSVLTAATQPAGTYTTNVAFTVVPMNQ